MDIERYLERIGYQGGTDPTIETLRKLHRRHLLSVPFENLNIPLGRAIELDLAMIYGKIVGEARGGFCYELNGLFWWLLSSIGFNVTRLSARVIRDGTPGPEFDHLVLLVALEDRWLVDVGFGDSFLEPLMLDSSEPVVQGDGELRLRPGREGITFERRGDTGEWAQRYVFSLLPREYTEYAGMCRHHQTSPESHFTMGWLSTRITPTGRVTVSNGRLIESKGRRRTETEISGPTECGRLLAKHTGVNLADADLVKLWEATNHRV
jgi:N-hydroxyarylamine O-acetyltransferase